MHPVVHRGRKRITARHPGIVAMAGRIAPIISLSGFARSSERQKAISSHSAAISVYPRTVRKLAVKISILIHLSKTHLRTVHASRLRLWPASSASATLQSAAMRSGSSLTAASTMPGNLPNANHAFQVLRSRSSTRREQWLLDLNCIRPLAG
jgi:hypothetical protein